MIRRIPFRAALYLVLTFLLVLVAPVPTRAAHTRASLGPVPTNCPPPPALQRFGPTVFGAGVGRNPVWAVGLRSSVIPEGAATAHGWVYKVLWAVAPHTAGKILLRGWNLRTGAPIWLSFNGGPATRGAAIGPRQAGALAMMPNGQPVAMHGWRGFPSGIYISSAGCYVLFAQWRTGAWIVPFAAGA